MINGNKVYSEYPIDLIEIRDRKQKLASNIIKYYNVKIEEPDDRSKKIKEILNEKQVSLDNIIRANQI